MTKRAIRWSGLFMIVGAVLLGTGIAVASIAPAGPQPTFFNVLLFLSAVLLLVSLPAMYAKQAERAGWLGLVGHALLEIGILLLVVAASPSLRNPSYNPPPSGENAVDGLLAVAFVLGLLLTAVATIRAGVYPRGAGILLLIGMASFFFGFFVAEYLPNIASQVSGALLGSFLLLAFAWIGLAMLHGEIKRNSPEAMREVTPRTRRAL